jgi:hypothetical protein
LGFSPELKADGEKLIWFAGVNSGIETTHPGFPRARDRQVLTPDAADPLLGPASQAVLSQETPTAFRSLQHSGSKGRTGGQYEEASTHIIHGNICTGVLDDR